MVHHPQDRTGREGTLRTPPGETIAALATPPGRGGVAIVRVSGPGSARVAEAVAGGLPEPRRAVHRRFLDAEGEVIDDGIVIHFPAPHSFTGESVVEFQGHGGPVVVDRLLARILGLGVRAARPGEFSERAFLNGRLDLVQAEAIADLIDSRSVSAARAARRSLDGDFSRRVNGLVERLLRIRVEVEAGIDFADEALEFIDEASCRREMDGIEADLRTLLDEASQGARLRDGLRIVIAGPPNAGKSSLLNRLARADRAIVTEVPGTTRDVLREEILIDDLPFQIVDTAGLRDSDDPVERIGIERAREQIAAADRILYVSDARETCSGDLPVAPDDPRLTWIVNKIDLTGRSATIDEARDGRTTIRLSARTGAGIDLLIAHLKDVAGHREAESSVFIARRRHIDALRRAHGILARIGSLPVVDEAELVAEELRLAQQTLGEITGEVTSDELLGRIFSSFCIGK